jgi:hypothetical protein
MLALTASAFAGSSAGNGYPQETNAPYVAWVGEQVRLTKCFWSSEDADPKAAEDGLRGLLAHAAGTQGVFAPMLWSGDPDNKPQFLNGVYGSNAVNGTIESQGVGIRNHPARVGLCYSIHVASDKPGMQVIKLAISPSFGPLIGAILGHEVAIKHDFYVIWLKSTKPVIKEVDSKSPGGYAVGDPAGDGKFQPPYKPCEDGMQVRSNDATLDGVAADYYGHSPLSCVHGLVKINVTGTFPLGSNFTELGLPATIELPKDWALLAGAIAFDTGGPNPMAWDIHDDESSAQTGHALGGPWPHPPIDAWFEAGAADHFVGNGCLGAKNTATDAVDNCWGMFHLFYGDTAEQQADAEKRGMSDLGPFSTLWFPPHVAIGPFDPLREYSSLFSDGKLNSGDAPMPALRVDVKLGDGSIGALRKADKDDIYVVDPTRPDGFPHNLYAPFYKAYIPAVGISGSGDPHDVLFQNLYGSRSGVAGAFANNFPGFIDEGVYDFWSTYKWAGREGYNDCKDPLGNPYKAPTGASHVSIYTDEHGEAYVAFYPYTGLNLTPDSNNRCDLSPGLYGTATITATGIYPDEPVTYEPAQGQKVSNTLTKTANHLASKVLKCVPKTVATATTPGEALCVETITDFNGDPIVGAVVQFSKDPAGGKLDVDSVKGTFGGLAVDTRDQGVLFDDPYEDAVILSTGKAGQVSALVTYTGGCVNVITENLGTKWTPNKAGVKRFFEINPQTGLPCNAGGGTTPPPPSGGGTGGGTTSTGGGTSVSATVSLGGPVIAAQPVLQVGSKPVVLTAATAKLFSVKVMQTKAGRFLVVNVKGKAKLAKIRFTIMGKNGKVLKTIIRTVPTNKAFTVSNLKLAKTAVSVKASVVA